MTRLRENLYLRYAIAIVVTASLMVWISVNEEGRFSELPEQAAFWLTAVTAGWLQMILISRGVRASFGTGRWPGWVLLIASALIGAVPITFEVRWLVQTILAPGGQLPPPWLTYLNVSVINTVFCLVQYVLVERWPLFASGPDTLPTSDLGDQPATEQNPEGSVLPAIGMLSRRPDGLNGIIWYMQMEDHYLRVFTNEGNGLTLHRMSDASRELQPTDGLQVHKSWWVSRAAIAEIKKEARRRIIVTRDGTEIPIGRSFEPDLRDNGWL